MKKYLCLFIIFIGIFFFAQSTEAAKKRSRRSSKGISCRSVLFSDSTQVKRLYGKNVQMRVLPASTAKVMTALLVLERLPLDSYITVNASATGAQPSKIYAKAGEQYKVSDLLYAILLSSANDASVVLAEAVAGSESKFVEMMNQRARQLGAKHTKFANSNGLPSPGRNQYTTAYDMYMIFRQAYTKAFFRQALRLKYKNIYSKGGRRIALKSHNKILFSSWKQNMYGKTGYTKAAGSCFVGAVHKENRILIGSFFGCTTQRWDDIRSVVRKYGGIDL